MTSKTNKSFNFDPAYDKTTLLQQELSLDVWRDKYRFKDEATHADSCIRFCDAVYQRDQLHFHGHEAYQATSRGLWIPGGRIQAGAGTDRRVTLFNCYVCREIHDSMSGIADALKDAMLTMQQGGGIGMNFSTLRPAGAILKQTGALASGPLPFMDMWDAMCATIMSAGFRRGAMMGVIHCEHPDLLEFIRAKHVAGRLTNFNMSVLVTDAFMYAVAADEDWHLNFHEPPASEYSEDMMDLGRYVYSTHKARDIWDEITRSSYEYSEPGVIFIDRVNSLNNLSYREDICCTNPCGEQPLPPNGACNLGAVNLARMVLNPFGYHESHLPAGINWELLGNTVGVGVRFLDNVIDITNYPLEAQRDEEMAVRRLGLGVTGLADMLAMHKLPYGSPGSVILTGKVMRFIANAAYQASAQLARQRGPFPDYQPKHYLERPFIKKLGPETQQCIREWGIRNGVILTIAPTGTTSIVAGNVSSGIEPVFDYVSKRKVLQRDDSHKEYVSYNYSYLLYNKLFSEMIPDSEWKPAEYMRTIEDLTIDDHLNIQVACQDWVDASVSKTINCPADMSFEDFKGVYNTAYQKGLKGCTTYMPSPIRGSVLEPADSAAEDIPVKVDPIAEEAWKGNERRKLKLPPRPGTLEGKTYKIVWPHLASAIYITINDQNGRAYEIFINSKTTAPWMTALSRMISAIMRRGEDVSFIPEELQQVSSVADSAWIEGQHFGSLIAFMGYVIQRHLEGAADAGGLDLSAETRPLGTPCTRCQSQNTEHKEGCVVCLACGYSACG